MHVFGFSPRKETPAAEMQDKVNPKVIKYRSQVLRDLGADLGHKFRQQFVNESETILIENSSCCTNVSAAGRSRRYFMVQLENTEQSCKPNDLVKVTLIKNREDGMIGRVNRLRRV